MRKKQYLRVFMAAAVSAVLFAASGCAQVVESAVVTEREKDAEDGAGSDAGSGAEDRAGSAAGSGAEDVAGRAAGSGAEDVAGSAAGSGAEDVAGSAAGSGAEDVAGSAGGSGAEDDGAGSGGGNGAEDGTGSAVGGTAAAEESGTSGALGEDSVPGQVQAPEVYEADFTGKSAGQQVHVTADAPVLVPRTEAIYLKQATRLLGDEKQMRAWLQTLFGSEKPDGEEYCADENGTIDYSGFAEAQGTTVHYELTLVKEKKSSAAAPGAALGWYWGEAASLDGAAVSTQEEAALKEQAENHFAQLTEKLGLTEFRAGFCEVAPIVYSLENAETDKKNFVELYGERMADGIPINYIDETAYPIYEEVDEAVREGQTDISGAERIWWEQERLGVQLLSSGEPVNFVYRNPLEISDYSDEKQFLLPFEEIRRIFEDTIAAQAVYAGLPEGDPDIHITKVQLGYMRIRDEEADSNYSGILIPVWDFYGNWANQQQMGYSFLTIDARDGMVRQRYQGY